MMLTEKHGTCEGGKRNEGKTGNSNFTGSDDVQFDCGTGGRNNEGRR